MWIIVVAVIMGIVEGLTEFVPVSSTGHLIIVGNLLNFKGDAAKCFEVFIQLGAILAVVWLYWDRFIGLLFPPKDKQVKFSGLRGIWLLILTTVPASIAGFFLHDIIKKYLFSPVSVVLALAVGAIAIIIVEKYKPTPHTKTLDELTGKQALIVGLFQCLSLWSGMSRSASTIMGGMLCRLDRKVAAVYSFLAAVPIMFAATFYDLYKSRAFLHTSDIPYFAVGFVVSFIFAAIAVKTFIKLLSRWTLVPFAVYRLIISVIVYIVMVRS